MFVFGEKKDSTSSPVYEVNSSSPSAPASNSECYNLFIENFKNLVSIGSLKEAGKNFAIASLVCICIHYIFDGVWPTFDEPIFLTVPICGETPVRHLLSYLCLFVGFGRFNYLQSENLYKEVSFFGLIFGAFLVAGASFLSSCLLYSALLDDLSTIEISLSVGDLVQLLTLSFLTYVLSGLFNFSVRLLKPQVVNAGDEGRYQSLGKSNADMSRKFTGSGRKNNAS